MLYSEFVGFRIGHGDRARAWSQDERGAGLPDGELGQEAREARVLDDNCKHSLPLLVDVDRPGESDRRMHAVGVIRDVEPLRRVSGNCRFEPFLLGDLVAARLERALLEFDVPDHHKILVDPALENAVDLRDLHHLQIFVAELVGGRERPVGQAERYPGKRRL